MARATNAREKREDIQYERGREVFKNRFRKEILKERYYKLSFIYDEAPRQKRPGLFSRSIESDEGIYFCNRYIAGRRPFKLISNHS